MRKKRIYKKHYEPDFINKRVDLGRFINYLMRKGNKNAASKIMYGALDEIKKTAEQNPLDVFEKAVANASPLMEVKSKRVGGANYQVPREVRPERKFFLACQWIIKAAKSKKGMPMRKKLAQELLAAYKNEGAAVKKKQDTHRMAEANRAFAHFAK